MSMKLSDINHIGSPMISKGRFLCLFREYLVRKEKERHDTSYGCVYNHVYDNVSKNISFEGIIVFYEWSDLRRTPMHFFSLVMFNDFLLKSGIFMAPYQRDMLITLGRSYVTCKKGKSELLIRGSLDGLAEALERSSDEKSVEKSIEKSVEKSAEDIADVYSNISSNVSSDDVKSSDTVPMSISFSNQLSLPYPVQCTYPPHLSPLYPEEYSNHWY